MLQPPLSTGASASRPPDDVAVVLVHGYLCVWPGLYWYGLRPLRRSLLARGIPVLTSRQPRTASVARPAPRRVGEPPRAAAAPPARPGRPQHGRPRRPLGREPPRPAAPHHPRR